jgi:amino acid transporter
MNAALAFGMVLVFLYCLGDVKEVASAVYPLMLICINATHSLVGSSAMLGGVLCTVISGTLGSVASTSRLTWAWARDGALPSYFAYVSPRYRIPLRSVWLPIVIVMLLSLLNLANYTAFSVIISLSTLGLYQSYFIAIACMLHARLTGRLETAPWSLGKYGVAINAFALLFSAWIMIFLVFPSYLPITPTYMNYALPINALVWIVATVHWFVWGKNNWEGLNTEIIEKVVADGGRDTKD